jgi:HTH-type transcriptional regulator/antitoxin HigA
VSVAAGHGRGTRAPLGATLYIDLVARFALRPLRSERDLGQATKIANELAIRNDLSRGEQDYLDVLTDLIEAYERAHHPIPDLSGPDMLRYLLEERGVSQAEAAREMGMAPSTVSDILRGKRGIGRKHIVAFVSYFHVSPTVFLSEPGSSES